MRNPLSWWRRFGLHLAAAVGATGIFVAAAAVGAHQQSAAVAGAVVVRTARPLRSPTPVIVRPEASGTPTASQTPGPSPQPAAPAPPGTARTGTSAPAQERSLAGTVQAVDADGVTLVTPQGRAWRVRPAPGALLRLDGKTIHAVGDLQVDDHVVALGVAEARDRFMAHAITARRPKT